MGYIDIFWWNARQISFRVSRFGGNKMRGIASLFWYPLSLPPVFPVPVLQKKTIQRIFGGLDIAPMLLQKMQHMFAIGETPMAQTRGEPLLHLHQPSLRSPAMAVLRGLGKLSPRREGIGLWDGSEPAPTVAGQQPAYATETPDELSSQGSPIARGQRGQCRPDC